MAQNNIPKLSQAQKELLLSKSPYALPDNPSDKHFSASQIKRKMYEGLLVLFDYLNAFIDSVNSNVTLSNQDLQNIQSDITTLKSYFDNNIAKRASADANGNDIASTYETKDHVIEKIGNALSEAKSYADVLVQRGALVSTLGEASIAINGLMSAQDKAHLDLLFSMLGSSPSETAKTFEKAIELLDEATKTYFVSDIFDQTYVEGFFGETTKIYYYDSGWHAFNSVEDYQAWASDKDVNTQWISSNDASINLSTILDTDEYCVFNYDNNYLFLITGQNLQFLIKSGDVIKAVECVGKAVDRKYFNGKFYAYQAKGETGIYKSIKISSSETATMGQLREIIDNINASGEHCLFDFSDFSANAYVCTVLMYSSGGLQNCLIFDIINGKTYADYYGYSDSTTIQRFFTIENGNRDLTVGNIPRVIQVKDNGQMWNIYTVLKSIKVAKDLGHNIFFDFSSFLPDAMGLQIYQHYGASEKMSFCKIEVSNNISLLETSYYSYYRREQGLAIIYDLVSCTEVCLLVNNNASLYGLFAGFGVVGYKQASDSGRSTTVGKKPNWRLFHRIYDTEKDFELKIESLQNSLDSIPEWFYNSEFSANDEQRDFEYEFWAYGTGWHRGAFGKFLNHLCDNFSKPPAYNTLYRRSFLATGHYNDVIEEDGTTYNIYMTIEELRVEKQSTGGNASTARIRAYAVCRGIKKNVSTGDIEYNVPYEIEINSTNFQNLRMKEQKMTFF